MNHGGKDFAVLKRHIFHAPPAVDVVRRSAAVADAERGLLHHALLHVRGLLGDLVSGVGTVVTGVVSGVTGTVSDIVSDVINGENSASSSSSSSPTHAVTTQQATTANQATTQQATTQQATTQAQTAANPTTKSPTYTTPVAATPDPETSPAAATTRTTAAGAVTTNSPAAASADSGTTTSAGSGASNDGDSSGNDSSDSSGSDDETSTSSSAGSNTGGEANSASSESSGATFANAGVAMYVDSSGETETLTGSAASAALASASVAAQQQQEQSAALSAASQASQNVNDASVLASEASVLATGGTVTTTEADGSVITLSGKSEASILSASASRLRASASSIAASATRTSAASYTTFTGSDGQVYTSGISASSTGGTSATGSSGAHHSTSHVGPAIGGFFGGLILLALVGLLVRYLKQKRQAKKASYNDESRKDFPQDTIFRGFPVTFSDDHSSPTNFSLTPDFTRPPPPSATPSNTSFTYENTPVDFDNQEIPIPTFVSFPTTSPASPAHSSTSLPSGGGADEARDRNQSHSSSFGSSGSTIRSPKDSITHATVAPMPVLSPGIDDDPFRRATPTYEAELKETLYRASTASGASDESYYGQVLGLTRVESGVSHKSSTESFATAQSHSRATANKRTSSSTFASSTSSEVEDDEDEINQEDEDVLRSIYAHLEPASPTEASHRDSVAQDPFQDPRATPNPFLDQRESLSSLSTFQLESTVRGARPSPRALADTRASFASTLDPPSIRDSSATYNSSVLDYLSDFQAPEFSFTH